MFTDAHRTPDQVKAAVLAIGLQAVFAVAFIYGLAVRNGVTIDDALKVVSLEPLPPPIVTPPPPPRQQVAVKPQAKRPEGRAAPPNLRATPTEIVLPPPIIALPPPPTINVAPIAGKGADASAGASDRAGPGTGAGGTGNGTGAGGDGDGDGGGGDGDTPPRQVGGRITAADYPSGARAAQISGRVYLSYRVGTDGRASDCRILRSSGSRELDVTTCELIEARFRFRPGVDADGKPFSAIMEGTHSWTFPRLPDEDRGGRQR